MELIVARPLVFGMAARVRRIPATSKADVATIATSNIAQATTSTAHLQWWHEQALLEAQYSPEPLASDEGARCIVYRLFGADDVLLYVGMTEDVTARFRHHSRSTSWWPDVARIAVEHFSSRADAAVAEKKAIVAESPIYNCSHNWARQ